MISYTQKGKTIQLNRVFLEEDGYQISINYHTLAMHPRLIVEAQRQTLLTTNTGVTLAEDVRPSFVISAPQKGARLQSAYLKLRTIHE